MAVESSRITAEVIEISEFPEMAQRYKVYGVPRVVLNETHAFEGALPEADFMAKVAEAAQQVA